MRYRYNTELPRIELPDHRLNYFSYNYLLGYLFLLCAFIMGVLLVYQMQEKSETINPGPSYNQNSGSQDSQICIQVITDARNPISGRVETFPTPCDVPEGWLIIPIGESVNSQD